MHKVGHGGESSNLKTHYNQNLGVFMVNRYKDEVKVRHKGWFCPTCYFAYKCPHTPKNDSRGGCLNYLDRIDKVLIRTYEADKSLTRTRGQIKT